MIILKERAYKLKPGTIVRIQKLKDDRFNWCIQYRGNGHYYKSFEAVQAYCDGSGWNLRLNEKGFTREVNADD